MPPPPNTWLITIDPPGTGVPVAVGEPVAVGVAVGVFVGVGVVDGVTVGVGVGPPTHACTADIEFRGAAVSAVKSVALLLVSRHPSLARISAFVLLGAGAGPPPSKQFAVAP